MKSKKWIVLITIISAVAAISAAVTAFFVIKEKQEKIDAELDAQLNDDLIA